MPTRPHATLAATLVSLSALSTAAQIHVYVDDDAPNGGDGLSWDTALNDLREAVALSESLGLDRGEIRIAGGTYLDDGIGSLELTAYGDEPELQLLGGFVGLKIPSLADERAPEDISTLILGQPDETAIVIEGVLGSVDSHQPLSSFGIGVASGFGSLLRFDGLRFSGGQAISIEAVPEFPVVINGCTFQDHDSNGRGGAIFARQASLLIDSSTFLQCASGNTGGAVDHEGDELVVRNSVFEQNSAGFGGGVFSFARAASIHGSSFTLNTASIRGGAAVLESSDPSALLSVVQCDFFGNTAREGGAVSLNASARLTGLTFGSNFASRDGGGIYVFPAATNGASLTVLGTDFEDGGATRRGGGVYVAPGGPATYWEGCDFERNSAEEGAGVYISPGGSGSVNHRMEFVDFISNEASVDGGGLIAGEDIQIRRGVFEDNSGGGLRALVEGSVEDSVFDSNRGSTDGAAIQGRVRIDDSSFRLNSTTGSGGGVSGAISISRSSFEQNSAGGWGGAVSSTDSIEESSFVGNRSVSFGGAFWDVGVARRVTVTENSSAFIGAVANFDLIEDSVIENNRATGDVLYSNVLMREGARLVRCRVASLPDAERPALAVAVAPDSTGTEIIDSLIQGAVTVFTFGDLSLVGTTLVASSPELHPLQIDEQGFAYIESSVLVGQLPVRVDDGAGLITLYPLIEGGLNSIEIGEDALLEAIGPVLSGDPRFADADGPDDDPMTFEDNDFSPQPGSPLIDAGFGFGIASDRQVDIAGQPRVVNDAGVPDSSPGSKPIDIGAFEFQGFTCLADVNGDGSVNSNDFFAWVNAFGSGDPRADQNRDGTVTAEDFFAWVNNFTAGC